MTDLLHDLYSAELTIGGAPLAWREIVGIAFGLAGAILGMRRNVWTWPVGLIGNAILFTVYLGAVFDTPQNKDLYGQAGRQVFFAALAVYGWTRWLQNRRESVPGSAAAVVPRWATARERLGLLGAAAVFLVAAYLTLSALDSYGPKADAWILVGSILATYAMARGWSDFWLIWIAVDVVGVPLLWRAGFYPSAVLYAVYGAFCVWGLIVWMRAAREGSGNRGLQPEPEVTVVG